MTYNGFSYSADSALIYIRECRIKSAFPNKYISEPAREYARGMGIDRFAKLAGPFRNFRHKGARLRGVFIVRGIFWVCIISTESADKTIAKLNSLAKMQVLATCLGLVTPLSKPRACNPSQLTNQNFLTHRVVPRVKMLGHLAVTDND